MKHLGPLLDTFVEKINSQERFMIKIETKSRIEFSQTKDFFGGGRAPGWSHCRGAPDRFWVLQKGWTGEVAVCESDCLAGWGHPHGCGRSCSFFGKSEQRRRQIEERLRNAEQRTLGEDYSPADMHRAQRDEVAKELMTRCDTCAVLKGVKASQVRQGLPVLDFDEEFKNAGGYPVAW
jgi:hypothetical protein